MKLETLGIYIYVCDEASRFGGALAQDEDSVCKARVRILLYERFPRFRPRARRAPRVSRGSGGLMGFRRIKGVADRIKAGDISSARYPPGCSNPAAFVPRKLREICPGERACCRSSCANAALMRPRIVKLAAASPETVH